MPAKGRAPDVFMDHDSPPVRPRKGEAARIARRAERATRKVLDPVTRWQLIDHSQLRNIGGSPHVPRAVYGRGGARWPRLVFAAHDVGEGITFSCDIKRGPRCWWETAPVPRDLLDEFAEFTAAVAREECDRDS